MIPEITGVTIDLKTGRLTGKDIAGSKKKLKEVPELFADKAAYGLMDENKVIYEVQYHCSVPEGTEGGLYFGTSTVHLGKVGAEYFMTKGHFHQKADTAEYYWGISGKGCLLLLSEDGSYSVQAVQKGSLHYIPGRTAHRLVNSGSEDLVVGACWPSDAGHNYGSIEESGFPVRVLEGADGHPVYIR